MSMGSERRRARTGDKWHLDEVFLKINAVTHYLWRAVDQNGVVLDILVQLKRDRFAAMRFFRLLLQAIGKEPRVIITDKLRTYGAAKRVVMPNVIQRQHRYLNNRAVNSHQQRGNASSGCDGSNPLDTLSDFSRYMESLLLISAPAAIYSPPLIIDTCAANDSRFGMK